MGSDWLDRFDVKLDDFRRVVLSVCHGHSRRFAEDVLGEVLLRIHRQVVLYPAKFSNKARLLNYASKIAIRDVIRSGKRAKRERPFDAQLGSERLEAHPDSEGMDTAVGEAPSVDELVEAIEDPRQREIFRLHINGYKGKDIAAKLGMSNSTISREIKKAKTWLRRKFRDKFDAAS